MKKKVLCTVLSAAMILSMAAVPAMAEGDNTLNVMLHTNVMSLDTNLATDGDSFEVIADCIDGLMQMDADGAAVNAIAEDVQVSDDGLTYTFKLREDAKWSNGDPVTANDFVFAWQRGAAENLEYGYMFSDIGQIVNAAEIAAGEMDRTELGAKAIDDYQYEHERFLADLHFEPDQFPVKKGDIIAWSGNEGYSFGPHLHMELHNSETGERIDPMPYFKDKILDTTPPRATA